MPLFDRPQLNHSVTLVVVQITGRDQPWDQAKTMDCDELC